jgi:glucosamine--fructose-6-phosphate aminotransferase (isomerizing)
MLPSQSPELIIEQLDTLPEIHRENFVQINHSIKNGFNSLELNSVQRVYTLGDGDSYHAALAVEMAFQEFAGIQYLPFPAMRFLEYGADYIRMNFPRDTIVVGISASGGSTRVIQSLERVKKKDHRIITASLVGNQESRLAEAADRVLSAQIPELGRIPGIRTYTASIMGLLALALRIGEIKRNYHMEVGNNLRREIIDMADMVNATIDASKKPASMAAKLIKYAPFISFVGSGPSFGSAYFSGAKIIEASGMFAAAQDLEEWAHVERLAYPLDYPVVMIAPPGKSYWRALELAKGIKAIGHPLFAIIDEKDQDIKPLADVVFPVIGEVREAFSPLLYYLPGTMFAYELTKELNRSMFMTDNEKIMKIRKEMIRQIQG